MLQSQTLASYQRVECVKFTVRTVNVILTVRIPTIRRPVRLLEVTMAATVIATSAAAAAAAVAATTTGYRLPSNATLTGWHFEMSML
jgi:hypothetical protein